MRSVYVIGKSDVAYAKIQQGLEQERLQRMQEARWFGSGPFHVAGDDSARLPARPRAYLPVGSACLPARVPCLSGNSACGVICSNHTSGSAATCHPGCLKRVFLFPPGEEFKADGGMVVLVLGPVAAVLAAVTASLVGWAIEAGTLETFSAAVIAAVGASLIVALAVPKIREEVKRYQDTRRVGVSIDDGGLDGLDLNTNYRESIYADVNWDRSCHVLVHVYDHWVHAQSGVWIPAGRVGSMQALRTLLEERLASANLASVRAVYALSSMHLADADLGPTELMLHRMARAGELSALSPLPWTVLNETANFSKADAIPISSEQGSMYRVR